MEKKCGCCQTNRIANSTHAPGASCPAAAAQPHNGGIAPGIAPTVVLKQLTRFIGVYTSTYRKAASNTRKPVSKLTHHTRANTPISTRLTPKAKACAGEIGRAHV